MLLMVEKGIRGGICHSIYWYAKANNKCMNDYDKNEESSYIRYWDVNNLYGWVMSQKLLVNNFESIKVTSQFKIMFNILKNGMTFTMIYHSYQKKWKLKKSKNLLLIYMIKLSMLYI